MTRNGKIPRLPREIRDELNCRLSDGEPGPQLLAWLNGLPEVQEILKRFFNGRPVSEQNLSDWRQGGYQDWLGHRELWQALIELDRQNDALYAEIPPRLSEDLWTMLGARAALLVRAWRPTGDAAADQRSLKALVEFVSTLRRSMGEAEATHLDSRRFDVERRNVELEERLAPERTRYYTSLAMAALNRGSDKGDAKGESRATAAGHGASGSGAVKLNQGESSPLKPDQAESSPIQPNPTESNPIKPNPTG